MVTERLGTPALVNETRILQFKGSTPVICGVVVLRQFMLKCFLHFHQGCGVEFLITLGVGFIVRLGSPTESFLHHPPKYGIPVEMVQILLKLLLKQNSYCVPRFPLIASCYKIVDSQTSFRLG